MSRDPVTGEELKLSDKISWIIQGLIRRWPFVIFNIVFSVTYWIHFHILTDPATAWNVVYSLMAIVIESVVGIGVFNMTRNDHATLLEMKQINHKLESLLELLLKETNITREELEQGLVSLENRLDLTDE